MVGFVKKYLKEDAVNFNGELLKINLIDNYFFIKNGKKYDTVKAYSGCLGRIIGKILFIFGRAFELTEHNGQTIYYNIESTRHLLTRFDKEKYPRIDLKSKNAAFIKNAFIELKQTKGFLLGLRTDIWKI